MYLKNTKIKESKMNESLVQRLLSSLHLVQLRILVLIDDSLFLKKFRGLCLYLQQLENYVIIENFIKE